MHDTTMTALAGAAATPLHSGDARYRRIVGRGLKDSRTEPRPAMPSQGVAARAIRSIFGAATPVLLALPAMAAILLCSGGAEPDRNAPD